jgi:hypothetical protein
VPLPQKAILQVLLQSQASSAKHPPEWFGNNYYTNVVWLTYTIKIKYMFGKIFCLFLFDGGEGTQGLQLARKTLYH